MRSALLAILLCLPAALAAQGSITGKLKDRTGQNEFLADAAMVGVVALPQGSAPFNELAAGTWQDAMTALSRHETPTTPFGGLGGAPIPEQSWFVPAEGDGGFALADLPLDTRLAIAAQLDGVWWPLAREVFLTAAAPTATIELEYFPLGGDATKLVIAEHDLEVVPAVRADLKYGVLTFIETIRVQNSDPSLGAMLELELPVAISPGVTARQLPNLYGSQLMFFQGTNFWPPSSAAPDELTRLAWTFGGADTMHGGKLPYANQAHSSADTWHALNDDIALHNLGAGETLYIETPSPSGRQGKLVFRRPVPPAGSSGPGTLTIRVLHRGGVLLLSPGDKVQLERTFPLEVTRATARVGADATLRAFAPENHRRLYAEPTGGARATQSFAAAQQPSLYAAETAQWVLGFTDNAQQRMREIEEGVAGAVQPDPDDADGKKNKPAGDQLKLNVLFQWMAILFGLAFVAALVASVRKPREKQLEALAKVPGSRAEMLREVADLEHAYKAGKLPPASYLDQKQRLLNRLIEHDTGAPGTQA